MADIIKFPKTSEKEFYNQTKVAQEAAAQMLITQEFLNYRLNFPDWNEYTLTESDVENTALYGEAMKLTPKVSARLNSLLATTLCKIKYSDPLDDF